MNIRAYALLLVTLAFARPLAAQQPIPFDVCALSTSWTRPSLDVQAKIWNQGRYSGSGPADYYWIHNFIVRDDPLSASGFDHLHNLTGLWTAPLSAFSKCDEKVGQNPSQWIEVWVLLHRVKEVTHADNTYTVTVEPTGRGFQSILIRRMNPSVVLRFVTPDGKELEKWDESAPPNRVKHNVPPGTRIIGPNGEIITKIIRYGSALTNQIVIKKPAV
jgi:hypothetical protein